MTKQEYLIIDAAVRRIVDPGKWETSPIPTIDGQQVVKISRKEANMLKRLLFNAQSETEYWFGGNTIKTSSRIEFRWLRGIGEDNSEIIYMFVPDIYIMSAIVDIWNDVIAVGYKKFRLQTLKEISDNKELALWI